ncbi:hypothetical protein ACFXGT_40425 [Streptomyces sp. NPDC059352]|uniref:hypothetical protein n=1 Tax=Streptomyces sp. NPDC059352 TaxID=3346810 RepID=UPI00369F6A06
MSGERWRVFPSICIGDAVHVVRDHPFEVGCERLSVSVPTPGHQVDDDDESLGPDLFERVDLLQRGDGDPVGDVLRWDDALEGVVGIPEQQWRDLLPHLTWRLSCDP